MIKKIIAALLIVLLIGFAFYSYGQLEEKQKLVGILEAQVKELKKDNDKITEDFKSLRGKLNLAQKQNEEFSIYDAFIQEDNKIEEAYPWLETQEWDKIVIVPEDTEDKYIFVNDARILNRINDFLYLEYETIEPPSGFKPDIPRFNYTFIKGDKQYDVRVVERGIVEIEGKYYVANLNVHKLGEALMPSPEWNKPGNIYTKIASGGILIADQGVSYSPFRMTMFADILTEGELLDNQPANKGEKKGESTLFSHGEEIKLESYDSYIHIVDDSQEYWYKLEDAAFYLYSIFFGMG